MNITEKRRVELVTRYAYMASTLDRLRARFGMCAVSERVDLIRQAAWNRYNRLMNV